MKTEQCSHVRSEDVVESILSEGTEALHRSQPWAGRGRGLHSPPVCHFHLLFGDAPLSVFLFVFSLHGCKLLYAKPGYIYE